MDPLLAELPTWGFGLVLVFSRVGAACILLPGVGEATLPARVRVGFTMAFTALLLPVLTPLLPPAPSSVLVLAGMVVAEIATGLWLGWMARLITEALPVGGQFIATMVGQASVIQPDPTLGAQSTALAKLFSMAVPVVVLSSGLYALPISALAGSYRLIAPGTLLPATDGVQSAVAALGQAFALSLRLAAPFVAAGVVWQVALGLLARLVPRLQVFAAAMPGQILGGLVLLALLTGGIISAWHDAMRTSLATLAGG